MMQKTWFGRIGLILSILAFLAIGNPANAQTADAPITSTGSLEAAQNASVPADDLSIFLLPLTGADLALVAETWQSHTRNLLEGLSATNLALRQATGAQEKALRARFAEESEAITVTMEKYQMVLDAWSAKGGADEDVAAHRSYVTAVIAGTLKTTDIKTLLAKAWGWLTSSDGGLGVVFGILGVVAAIWVMMIVSRIVRNMAHRGLDRVPTMSRLLKSFVIGLVYWATLVLGVLVVLGLFGVNVTPLFAVFGGLSFILGFALQETLGNLASGLMIMVLKPFDTGDYIQVGGASGTVDEMSVVSTKIRTFDNQIIIVPNNKIWGDTITNVSAAEERRVDLVFGIGYSDSAARAIEVLQMLVESHQACLADPPPEIFVGELGESSVNIFCRPWVKSEDYWDVYWDLTGQAKDRFDAEGISIPFPQRDVHLIQSPEAV